MILHSKAWRWVLLLTAIVTLGWAAPGLAQTGSCDSRPGIGIDEARLLFVPHIDGRSGWLRLSGQATIPPDLPPDDLGQRICRAAVGQGLLINGRTYCGLFENRALTGHDRIERAGNLTRFALVTPIELRGPHFLAVLETGVSICAPRLIIEVRPGAGGRFHSVYGRPRLLRADRAEFEILGGASEEARSIAVNFNLAEASARRVENRPMVGPKSWRALLDESLSGFGSLLSAFCVVLGVLLLFTMLLTRVPPPSSEPSPWDQARTPIVVALSMLLAGALFDAAVSGANVIQSWLREQPSGEGGVIARLATWSGLRASWLAFQAALLVGFAAAASIVHLVTLPLTGGRSGWSGPLAQIPRIWFYAGAIAVAAAVPAMVIWAIEPVPWLGFEAPALLVSLGYALLGASVVSALYDLRTSMVFWISLLVALTVLFPTDPVLRSSSEVEISWHSFAWARFVAAPAARFLYIAALAGLALRIAGRAELDRITVGKWLGFLLLLQIAGLSMATPTTVLAVAGVLLLSLPWLFPASAGGKSSVRAGVALDEVDAAFPWIVGGAAAAIFLLQYVFRAGNEDNIDRFAMLSLGGVLPIFAIGVTAGLLLARAMPVLRGDSATLKAAHVSLLIVLANTASVLDMLRGRERFVAVLTENAAVIGALILCAVVRFDLARVRTADGGFKWRDLFRGTALAQSVPVVTTVAAALFTALAPIIVGEIGEAFGELLKSSQPQTQTAR